ncbi:hypothetical protein SAMN05216602_0326 [Pseudomonas argentinensis]|uniref:Uncharacterized protein n=1 Tax=Phytopseudomonas argentinensis TaxID=289370 RepID=A0A1I3GS94_9GAMM|nr:hypothetical protein SAMN05216602_0326 [Pseudomonas argentinensis]
MSYWISKILKKVMMSWWVIKHNKNLQKDVWFRGSIVRSLSLTIAQ